MSTLVGPPQLPDKKNETERSPLVRKRILVVDDDPSVREMLARVLVGEGYVAIPACDGLEALKIANGERINLVLLDLNLPGMSGWDTFASLNSDHPDLPVIIVTARANQVFTGLSAGVSALLEKPLDFHNLLQTIRNALAKPVRN